MGPAPEHAALPAGREIDDPELSRLARERDRPSVRRPARNRRKIFRKPTSLPRAEPLHEEARTGHEGELGAVRRPRQIGRSKAAREQDGPSASRSNDTKVPVPDERDPRSLRRPLHRFDCVEAARDPATSPAVEADRVDRRSDQLERPIADEREGPLRLCLLSDRPRRRRGGKCGHYCEGDGADGA
jgi:hypothetical protein